MNALRTITFKDLDFQPHPNALGFEKYYISGVWPEGIQDIAKQFQHMTWAKVVFSNGWTASIVTEFMPLGLAMDLWFKIDDIPPEAMLYECATFTPEGMLSDPERYCDIEQVDEFIAEVQSRPMHKDMEPK